MNKIKLYYLRIFSFSFMILLSVMIISSFVNSNKAKAANVENIKYKYFHMITIEAGDSLWSLSKDSGYESSKEFINEVKKTNHLKSDLLIAGDKIMVPYYSYEFK